MSAPAGYANSFSKKILARAQESVFRQASIIAHLDREGRKRSRDRAIRNYLNSHDARLVAALEANRSVYSFHRLGTDAVLKLAERINLFAECAEPVCVKLEEKSSNPGYRVVNSFGIENRARQQLLMPLLRHMGQHRLSARQFALKGTHKAIAEIIRLMNEGYVWAIETDIKNCFPSLQGDLSGEIPLPGKVIRNTILANGLNMVPGDRLMALGAATDGKPNPFISQIIAEAQQGIPQGSTVASIAAELVLARPLCALPDGSVVIGYADNFLAMGRVKEEAASTTKALWSLFSGHPVGQLLPSKEKCMGGGGPIEFIGHEMQLFGKNVSAGPSYTNCRERHRRYKNYLSKIADPKLRPSQRKLHATDAERYVRSWAGSFAMCDGMEKNLASWLGCIQKARLEISS